MAKVARNHHFIPQCFLAGFTPSGTKDDKLWVTDTVERKGYATRPRNAGFEKDLYRIDVDGAPPDLIETIFGCFEGLGAPSVRYVLENCALPPRPDFDHLMEFVGLLAIRVPRTRERVAAVLDRTMKAMFRPYFRDPDAVSAQFEEMRQDGADIPEDIDCEELVRFVQSEDLYTMRLDKEWLLGQMLEGSVEVQQMLFERNWSVLSVADDAEEFICSDAPVCLTWNDTDRQDRVARLYEHETTLTVPLGKGVALQGRYEAGQPKLIRCSRQDTARINTRTISSRHRFLYSSGKRLSWERGDGSIGDWDALMTDLETMAKDEPN